MTPDQIALLAEVRAKLQAFDSWQASALQSTAPHEALYIGSLIHHLRALLGVVESQQQAIDRAKGHPWVKGERAFHRSQREDPKPR